MHLQPESSAGLASVASSCFLALISILLQERNEPKQTSSRSHDAALQGFVAESLVHKPYCTLLRLTKMHI